METSEHDLEELKSQWIKYYVRKHFLATTLFREQLDLKSRLVTFNNFDWNLHDGSLRYVGGVDISFVKDTDEACASLVVLSFPDLQVVYTHMEMVKLKLPYIPTFLAFREVEFLAKLVDHAKLSCPFVPQVILVDGNGMLHPRGFGTACHLGVVCDIPTIGIGKTYLLVEDTNISIKEVKEFEKKLAPGEHKILAADDTPLGAMVRTTAASERCIFVSVGHRISLSTALEVVKRCCRYRIPEPVRQADLLSRNKVAEYENGNNPVEPTKRNKTQQKKLNDKV